MPRWMTLVLVSLLLTLFAACGDDTTKKGGNNGTDDVECPAGQRHNPILDRCEDIPDFGDGSSNNGETNNEAGNNGATNNGSNSSNNQSTNNQSTNNGATNNDTTNTNNQTTPPLECGIGSIKGKTCAPSGEPLAAADVTISGVDCDGNPFELTARTGTDGTFELTDVPSGNHELKVTTGSFESTRMVIVQKDQVTDLTTAAEKVCLDQNVEIAVISGAYDHVEGVLQALNLDFTTVGGDNGAQYEATKAFLSDAAAMGMYDLIFINCGELEGQLALESFGNPQLRTTINNNLRTYVQGGGSLYVSDWSHSLLEGAFPDMIDFHGSDSPSDSRKGYAPQTIAADVLTPDLVTLLGTNTATIEFPHNPPSVVNNNWVIVDVVGAGSVAQLTGDAKLCGPPEGGLFGDPCPASSDVQADSPLLVTHKDPSGGNVVFTTFHNERQSALNQDMEKILRFLIFQL